MNRNLQRMFSLLLSLLLVLCLVPAFSSAEGEPVWDGSIASSFAGGTGTEDDPYLISNGGELAFFAQSVNGGTSYANKYLKLTADIYLNHITDWESWGTTTPANEWTAIGAYTNSFSSSPFSGNFNGDGHIVYGIYINKSGSTLSSTDNNQGLFGCCSPDNSSVNVVIANVSVKASYIYGYYSVGGVVGLSDTVRNGTITIADCYNGGTVSGTEEVGGVAGCCSANGRGIITLTGCCNTGKVSSKKNCVGGVVGKNCVNGGTATVTNCYNTGTVSGTGNCVGGVVGYNNVYAFSTSYSPVTSITACYNVGTVSGTGNCVGGVAGLNRTDGSTATAKITDCYYLDTCGRLQAPPMRAVLVRKQ